MVKISKLVSSTLFILVFLSFISVIFGNTFIGSTNSDIWSNDIILNGSASNLLYEQESYFNIDMVTGIIALLTILGTLALVFGIQVLGTGLNDEASRTIKLVIVYTGIWLLFSTLAWNLIVSIELFGSLIYVGLTIVYIYGCIQQIAGGGT